MNADGLKDRLAQVRKRIAAVSTVLRSASPTLVARWRGASVVGPSPLEVDPTRPPDPNVLCVPQLIDYELVDASDADGATSTANDA